MAVFARPVAAQPDGGIADGDNGRDIADATRRSAPQPVSLAPFYAGGVLRYRGIHIPVNLRLAPERRISVGYTASNSYLNPGLLYCRVGDCSLPYATDHTGNLLFVNLSQPLAAAWEIGFGVGSYRMDDIPRWAALHRLASDGALRGFHENILGEDSLPEISGAADDRQIFALADFSGKSLELKPEHSYSLPLRVDLTRYFTLRETARARMGLNVGLHLSWPFESGSFSRGADLGIAVNFIRSLRVSENVSSTFHVQVARFRSDVHVVNPAAPLNGDDSMRSQYALTYGLRFAGTFGGMAPCSFSMSQSTNSAHYDKDSYYTWDPLVFEGGNNLRGALAGSNDFGALSYGCEYRGRQYQITLVEDIGGFSQFIGDDGAGTSYDPDFSISLSVSFAFGAPRGTVND